MLYNNKFTTAYEVVDSLVNAKKIKYADYFNKERIPIFCHWVSAHRTVVKIVIIKVCTTGIE